MLENTAETHGKSILETVLNKLYSLFLIQIMKEFLSMLFVIFDAILT